MRISDWSSDVCSSDLSLRRAAYTKSIDGTGGTGNAAGNQGWGLLFVNAGLEPERPLEAQKDSFCGAAAALPPSTAPTAATAGWCAASARSIRASTLAVLRQHRSEEHTSELQSLMRISYAVFC